MKMKYCPECGSIQIQMNLNAMQCKKCSYLGEMKEDSIDVINAFIKSKNNNTAIQSSNSSFQATELIQQNKPEQQSLKDRLKKFEGSDLEIL